MKHFKIEEFKCKCCGEVQMDQDFLNRLDNARAMAGVPFRIVSGYRCPKHNKAVGSTSTNHTRGKAADIRCMTGPLRFRIVFGCIEAGFRRFGIGKDFVHVDSNDLVDSAWLY